MTPARRTTATHLLTAALLLTVGFGLGVWLRPSLGDAWRKLRAGSTPPRPLSGELYGAQANQFARLDPLVPPGAVVYLGDSLTARLCLDEWLACDTAPLINRAISGDTTAGVLRRVQSSFPRACAVCVLLIGFNDLRQGASAAEVAERTDAICRTLLSTCGARQILLETVLPGPPAHAEQVSALNRHLLDLASRDERIHLLDLHPAFLTAHEQDPTLFTDQVHLTPAGLARRVRLEVAALKDLKPELGLRSRLPAGEGG